MIQCLPLSTPADASSDSYSRKFWSRDFPWQYHEVVVWYGHLLYQNTDMFDDYLTHWGRVTHICVGNLTIIGSDNGLSPGRRQAITWTNVGILLIGLLGTNFSEMSIEIHTFSFKKIHLKMSSGKWQQFCLGLNVLMLSTSFDFLPVNFVNMNERHINTIHMNRYMAITTMTIDMQTYTLLSPTCRVTLWLATATLYLYLL